MVLVCLCWWKAFGHIGLMVYAVSFEMVHAVGFEMVYAVGFEMVYAVRKRKHKKGIQTNHMKQMCRRPREYCKIFKPKPVT